MKHSKTVKVPKWVKVRGGFDRDFLKAMIAAITAEEHNKLNSKKQKDD